MSKKNEFEPICEYVCDTKDRVEGHKDASPELVSAVTEFRDKSHQLHENFKEEDLETRVIEIEQAADSALRVAKASQAPSDLTYQIEDAHNRIKDFKDSVLAS